MAASDNPSRAYLIKLRDNLVAHCTDVELQVFCFDLGVDYETVVASKSNKTLAVMALINYLNSRGRLAELVERARREFPNVDWDDTSVGSELLIIESLIHLELVRVPAGEFLMGSDPTRDKDAQPNEQPQHKVYVSEFYIGKYPITNAQYGVYARAKRIEFHIPGGKVNHPVGNVSWHDASAFCEWLSAQTRLGVRLPTEAEWEKAARGTDGRIYPWGNQVDPDKADIRVGYDAMLPTRATTPVGKYSPAGNSPYGASDMAGNVLEWCSDGYDPNEYRQRIQSGVSIRDPTGPTRDYRRVLRGGAFHHDRTGARCAVRVRSGPGFRHNLVGFRVVVSSLP